MTEKPDLQKATQRAAQPDFLTKTRFDDFDIPTEILAGLTDAKFKYCTPIQAQTLPISLTGTDIAGQAQTGTGKTAAFMVTVFSRLLLGPKDESGLPQALIVAPTRELALQIHEDSKIIGRYTGLSLAQVVGGIDYQKQANILRKGVDIVICTPGRIIDYLKQGIFKTDGIKIVVIDEADRLFDLGFTNDMRFILKKLPHYNNRQTMLFSATMSYRVLELTYDFMNLPEFISVVPDDVTVKGVDQVLFHVGKEEKLSLLLGILKREKWTRVLIFVNTKFGVELLAKKLKGNGLPAEGITGDLPQRKRLKLMEQFKNDKIKILVATDVASRGIHIDDISHAINYDLPQDAENYVHRIGRTARAGKTGKAISLACEEYVYHLEPLEELLGYKIPLEWPDDQFFEEDKAGYIKMEPAERRKSGSKQKAKSTRKQPASHPFKNPKMSIESSQPGGIFGLAPPPRTAQDITIPAKKKKRRKPRSRKKSLPASSDSSKVN